MRASKAPVLINVFIFLCRLVCFVSSRRYSRSTSNSPHGAKSPELFLRDQKRSCGIHSSGSDIAAVLFSLKGNLIGSGISFLPSFFEGSTQRRNSKDAPSVGDNMPLLESGSGMEDDDIRIG